MKILLLVSVLLLSVAAIADQAQDQAVLIKTEDAEMIAAIQHAQATLDDFLKLNANPPDGASGFKVKVRITDSHGTEHMWVTPFKQLGSGFTGVLSDEPEYVTNVKKWSEADVRPGRHLGLGLRPERQTKRKLHGVRGVQAYARYRCAEVQKRLWL
jgi:uncharacterized protein YegJ (DUF2314 family)